MDTYINFLFQNQMVKPFHFQAYSLKQHLIMQMFLNITLIYMQSYYKYFIDLVSLEQCKIPTRFCAKNSFVRKRRGKHASAWHHSSLIPRARDRFRYRKRDHPREYVMSRSNVPRNHFGNLQVFKALTRLGDP